jgi:hypothetical protein
MRSRTVHIAVCASLTASLLACLALPTAGAAAPAVGNSSSGGASVPVSVVVRVVGAPGAPTTGATPLPGPEGDRAAAEASALSLLAISHPQLQLTAAIPPYLLDEWAGNAAAAAAGSSQDTSESDTSAGALDALKTATSAGMALLREMYSDPDLAGVAKMRTQKADIADQFAIGDRLIAAALSSSVASGGVAVADDMLPSAVAMPLVAANASFVLLDPRSVHTSSDATAADPGAYRLTMGTGHGAADLGITGLVVDRQASKLLAAGGSGQSLASYLLARSLSAGANTPVVIEVSVGQGAGSVTALQAALTRLSTLAWVRLQPAADAASRKPRSSASLEATPPLAGSAPAGYWVVVRRGLVHARALEYAAGTSDTDARTALQDALLAESRTWSGPGASWALADSGLAFSQASQTVANGILSRVSVDAPTVTLSGSIGRVPVNINNASSKTLRVVVRVSSKTARLTRPFTHLTLQPGENILSVPVDLRASVTSSMNIDVAAGGLHLTSTVATVKASYLDRLVLVLAVVLVLAGILVYVGRLRARAVRGKAAA